MRILVVEDEPKTAAYLSAGLTDAGFEVEVATRGDEGLLRARIGEPDLVVLDVMLPRRTGWEILAELRGSGRAVPVLFLTARDAVEDRVRGLELGADDYLVKPFAFAELLARVRTILRRGAGRSPETLAIADLRLDPYHQMAIRDGRDLHLRPKEFVLLALLVRRAGEVLSRRMIAEEVWGMRSAGNSNALDVAVRRLRAKVDDPFAAKLIHTVRGVGYVLDVR